jgi:spore germination protein GerM
VKSARAIALLLLFALGVAAAWWYFSHRPQPLGETIVVYSTQSDGTTEVPWRVSLGPARDVRSVAFYAATQAVVGPPSGTDAVRFPVGTRVRAVDLNGATVTVDLSGEVAKSAEGGFVETAEFKSLVWTLTELQGITAVRVRIDGTTVATLPGGHLELDEPLTRSSF